MPSANWYPDPQNHAQLRWWDGARWTMHVLDAPARRRLQPAAVVVIVLLGSLVVLGAGIVTLIMFMGAVVR